MKWISFANKFPKHNQRIKVKSDDLWQGEGIWQDGKFVYSWVKGACFGNPTHWMPLPDEPKMYRYVCPNCLHTFTSEEKHDDWF